MANSSTKIQAKDFSRPPPSDHVKWPISTWKIFNIVNDYKMQMKTIVKYHLTTTRRVGI